MKEVRRIEYGLYTVRVPNLDLYTSQFRRDSAGCCLNSRLRIIEHLLNDLVVPKRNRLRFILKDECEMFLTPKTFFFVCSKLFFLGFLDTEVGLLGYHDRKLIRFKIPLACKKKQEHLESSNRIQKFWSPFFYLNTFP